MTEQPLRVSVSDEDLDLLHRKLDLATFPDELEEAGWEYGAPLADVKRLVAYWKDGFDWRKAEAEINESPHFTRDIEVDGFGTLNIHYIHQKSSVEAAIPLIFIHGWPGSFIEARKILPLLTSTSPEHPSFHVVVLSLPGYGFSEAPKKKDFGASQYAEVANKLMLALGYNEYVTQGGDWGSFISRLMAHKYGHKHVKAWHTNFAIASPPSLLRNPLGFLTFLVSLLSSENRAGLAESMEFQKKSTGYLQIQSTRPQTLGYSLADSPVGLLAWIYEKLVGWTDDYHWTDDEILTWISVYYFSRAGAAASVRIYFEVIKHGNSALANMVPYSSTPFGVSYFPKEVAHLPRSWSHWIGNLVHESVHDHGGHFAATECPEELVGDLRAMFGKNGPAYGVVPTKTGYA